MTRLIGDAVAAFVQYGRIFTALHLLRFRRAVEVAAKYGAHRLGETVGVQHGVGGQAIEEDGEPLGFDLQRCGVGWYVPALLEAGEKPAGDAGRHIPLAATPQPSSHCPRSPVSPIYTPGGSDAEDTDSAE